MGISPADLRSVEARAIAARARQASGTDPLRLVAQLRREYPGADPDLVAAIATQERLRTRAEGRLGAAAASMVLTEAGVQQATRAPVARYRARELARRLGSRGGTVADVGCGLGSDAIALAEAGFDVLAVEQDEWTAQAAEVNLEGLRCSVIRDNARELDLTGCRAAYCDPARRSVDGPLPVHGSGRPRPESDPQRWSPPWGWVTDLAERVPVVAKAAAGIPASAVPESAEREWIEMDGDVLECCVWFHPLGHAGRRRATLIAADGDDLAVHTLAADGTVPRVGVVAGTPSVLLEPRACAVRAGLVDAVAMKLGVGRACPEGTWLAGDAAPASPWVRAWPVLDVLPDAGRRRVGGAAPLGDLDRDRRAVLRDLGPITWKTADAGISADEAARRLGSRVAGSTPRHGRGGPSATVVLLADGRALWVAEPATPAGRAITGPEGGAP